MKHALRLAASLVCAAALPGCYIGDTSTTGSAASDPTASDDAGTYTDPYDTPVQCTSGTTWTQGNRESPLMHPGGACIACHSKGDGPRLTLAGTVFPTAHEPDDCNGVSASAGVTVVITDANGTVLELTPNAAGNFFSRTAITMPYKAVVKDAQGERAMGEAQTSGDCNSCHTESGANNAPGRIMAP